MKLMALLRPVLWFPRKREPQPRAALPPRRRARAAIAWFAILLAILNVTAFVIVDASGSQLRDPEYGRRVSHLRKRVAENPGRPLVLVVGSSRASMGVRPTAWEQARPGRADDPLIFNMSLVGSGPLMELMCLRRLYADGITPDAVVLEYWPPFLREDGPYFEPDRIDHARLFDVDRPLVREYWRDPRDTEAKMNRDRFNPLFETRHRLLPQIIARWQPWEKRVDLSWIGLDEWGWLSGLEDTYPPDPKARSLRLKHCELIYRPQFTGYTIDPMADRAFRESVALARSHGTRVIVSYLPEATEFRSWMSPEAEHAAQDYLAKLRSELNLPLIDLRHAMPDGYLVDGFHLSKDGAAIFTRTHFGPAVAEALK